MKVTRIHIPEDSEIIKAIQKRAQENNRKREIEYLTLEIQRLQTYVEKFGADPELTKQAIERTKIKIQTITQP